MADRVLPSPTPRELWGTCCPDDPECEHSFMETNELTHYLDTPLSSIDLDAALPDEEV